jgi:hypothetical protein
MVMTGLIPHHMCLSMGLFEGPYKLTATYPRERERERKRERETETLPLL